MSVPSKVEPLATDVAPQRAIHYLPGLDGLRALAATIVLFWHVDRFSFLFGLAPIGYGRTTMAQSAVTLFFVLSGYLITSILLAEKERFGVIGVKRFYLRRALRIWPIYYLVILLALALTLWFPEIARVSDYRQFLLYIFPLPNVAYAYALGVFCLLPLWSVGVEEQFYLVWPWVIERSKNLLRTLILISVFYLAIKIGLRFLENGSLYRLWRITSVDSLALGGLTGWAVHVNHRWLEKVFSKPAQLLSWGLLSIFILFRPLEITSALSEECHALVYACLIANVSKNPRTLIRLEWAPLRFLGRISYGIYVFHLPIMMMLGLVAGPKLSSLGSPTLGVVLAALSTYTASILVASASFYLIESPFLRLRYQFTRMEAPRVPPEPNELAPRDSEKEPGLVQY